MTSDRVEEVSRSLRVLRVTDRETAYFEALWEIPEGVTYNAYLLETREGAVLFDGWKSQYSQTLIETLESLISPSDLKYIVVHHAEPDHAGSLPALLRWASRARVLGHPSRVRCWLVRPASRGGSRRLGTVDPSASVGWS